MVAIEITRTCAACPVQFEGTVDGKHLYFRARWEHWTVVIADGDAIDAYLSWSPALYFRRAHYGPEDAMQASWMPTRIAQRIIERCVAEYLSDVRGELSGKPPRLTDGAPAIVWHDEYGEIGVS